MSDPPGPGGAIGDHGLRHRHTRRQSTAGQAGRQSTAKYVRSRRRAIMRPADAHLTPQELQDLFFAAAEPNVTSADRNDQREAQQHLDGCDVCKGMARKYANADSLLRAL